MHFIGMLAFTLDTHVHYSSGITVLSALPSVLASWVTIAMLSHETITLPRLFAGGLAVGSGIGAMHDVGKIGIPDAILQEPGKLNAEEWEVMRQHPEIGARIIGEDGSELLRMTHSIALGHHEKWNDTGQVCGL